MSYCSDITKNRILECAKGEFLSKGFENAQVAEIAKLAKVTTGAIYRHFKNKEALFFALIEEEYNYTLDVVSDVEKRSEQKTIRIDSDLVDDEVIIENLFLETMLFVDYMYAHFDQPLTMEKIAEAIHFSPGYLSRTFKAEMHVTVGEYLNRLRIEKAEGILKTGDFPVMEVAIMTGFSSYAKFSVEFKKYTGKTAREYMAAIH